MITAEVAVIGGGIAGLSTAHHLLAGGRRDVVVLERGHLGGGSSGLSVGIVETQYDEAVDVHARVYGRAFFSDLEARHGLHFERCGYLRVAEDDAGLEVLERSVQTQRRFGVVDARLVSPEEAARIAPGLDIAPVAGGLWGPSDGYLDGYVACQVLAERITQAGGTILQRAAVTGAIRERETWHLETGRGTVSAPAVVNAAGPWAAQVGALLGAEVPLSPQRHHAAVIELDRVQTSSFPCFIDYVPGQHSDALSLRWESRTQLVACIHNETGTHATEDPDSPNPRSDDEFELTLAAMIDRRFPTLEAGIGRTWSGLYPMTPDGRPIVGRHPARTGVWCALGGGGSGIQLAPMMGALAAESILDRGRDVLTDAQRWSPDRY